ncbi:MAG: hypothetical protein RQ867_09165 [Mariprofundaceae bacterium]|nr:hypothetical protein [Mariprofundaceae bacterium]
MFRILLAASFPLLAGCGETTQPTPVAPREKTVYEKNATDAAGVAEGSEQVSPFGKPAH